jgi:aminopeptidase N
VTPNVRALTRCGLALAVATACGGVRDEASAVGAARLTYRSFPVDLSLPEVDAIGYEVDLSVTGTPGHETFRADVTGTYVATRDLSELSLDFQGHTIDEATVNGKRTAPHRTLDRLVLPFPHGIVRGQSFRTRVIYHGLVTQADGADPNDFTAYGGFMVHQRNLEGRRIFNTLSWPSKARRWLPLRDHPRDAAQVAFSLTWPASFTVLANGRRVRVRDNGNGTKTWRYEALTPMPTYDLHIAAYERWNSREMKSSSLVPLLTFTYEASAAKEDAIYKDLPRALDFYEATFGRYRWGTLTFIEEPIFGGGMEHATAISMDETLFSDVSRARMTAIHELAHHWSGNLIRIRQWNEFWLSEGFADYLTGRALERLDGPAAAQNTWRSYLRSAIHADHQSPHPLAPPGPEIDVLTIFDAISYQRGALTLRMLEHMIGEATFRAFLASWFDRHAFVGGVTTDDFQHELESATGKDLSPFFTTFVRGMYHPELRVSFAPAGSEIELTIEQIQPKGPPLGFLFPLELELVSASGARERVVVELRGRTTTHRVRPSHDVREVIVDPDAYAIAVTTCNGATDGPCKAGYQCNEVRPGVSACIPGEASNARSPGR